MMSDAARNTLRYSYGYSMGVLWRNMNMELEGRGMTFEQQTEDFFSMLEILMMEGRLKLACNGVFAVGRTAEQLDVLRRAWPARRDQADLDEEGIWFLSDAPFGLVWMSPEGEVWT